MTSQMSFEGNIISIVSYINNFVHEFRQQPCELNAFIFAAGQTCAQILKQILSKQTFNRYLALKSRFANCENTVNDYFSLSFREYIITKYIQWKVFNIFTRFQQIPQVKDVHSKSSHTIRS